MSQCHSLAEEEGVLLSNIDPIRLTLLEVGSGSELIGLSSL